MERWKTVQGPTCKDCLNTFDERVPYPSNGNMITSNGHGTPLKNPQNLTAGCNGNLLLKKGQLIKTHINNGHPPEKNGHHLDFVKDSLCCCLKQSQSSLQKQEQRDNSCDDTDFSCGLWSLKPRWMQPLANKKVFLAVFCLTSVLQGMYYTYFVSVLTTIEKLYQIQSKTTGLIMSATEVGQIGGALLLTYYGGQGHRPKWIACGMLVFAAASIFCATPHFLYSDLTRPMRSASDVENSSTIALRELRTKLCNKRPVSRPDVFSIPTVLPPSAYNDSVNATSDGKVVRPLRSAITEELHPTLPMASELSAPWTDKCERSEEAGALYSQVTHTVLVIFFISLLLIGIGATAVYTLGIPYIDDNVATRESPLYFGITIGVRIFGPVFGFLLGSFCTNIPINFPFESTEISTDNPQWLGAWWLGVLIVGAALIVTAFPMMAFPKTLPNPCQLQLKHSVNHNNSDGDFKSNGIVNGLMSDNRHCHHCQQSTFYDNRNETPTKPSLKDFPSAVRRLLKNEILLYRTASSVLHILPIAGLYTFLPKYLESQFQLTATMANMITGMAGILVMGIGIFASGTFMRTFKPNARFVAGWIACSALFYSIGMMLLMLFGCPLNRYVGLNAGSEYDDASQLSCNETCGCKPGVFAPICTSEGVTYLSPCLAGCREVSGSSYEQLVYKDCLCLGANVTAVNGFCPLKCGSLIPYIFVFAFFVLVHATSEVGSMLLTLRCVEPKDKAMALGLTAFAIGLFGNVPCPIIYGAVVDSACLFWEDNCGKPGACRLYDPSKFRGVFHGVTAVIMLMACCIDVVVWCKGKAIQFHEEDVLADVEETVPFNETQATSPQLESSV